MKNSVGFFLEKSEGFFLKNDGFFLFLFWQNVSMITECIKKSANRSNTQMLQNVCVLQHSKDSIITQKQVL